MTKTVLWTIPSGSTGLGEVDITLSDDVNNYDFIGIRYHGRRAVEPYADYDMILPIDTYNNSIHANNGGIGYNQIYLAYYNNSSIYYRTAWKVSNTKFHITTRNGGYSDLGACPFEIYGLSGSIS